MISEKAGAGGAAEPDSCPGIGVVVIKGSGVPATGGVAGALEKSVGRGGMSDCGTMGTVPRPFCC